MADWKGLLADVDDDYLIGISNKGIVKRAYKDKEEIAAVIEGMEEEASVKVGEETVKVRFPLGESKCSCPSRSICRHVVQAILVLREKACQSDGEAGEALQESSDEVTAAQGRSEQGEETKGSAPQESSAQWEDPQGARESGEEKQKKISRKSSVQSEGVSNAGALGSMEAPGKVEPGDKEAPWDGVDGNRQKAERSKAAAKVCKEIEEFPLGQLKKVLGGRQLQVLYHQCQSGVKPQIQYTSIVTVHLPEQGMVVKLLSPLEYSSCTCHKKEMCAHKAAAILWCKLEEGMVQKEELALEAVESPAFQMDKAGDAAGQMKGFLEELFCTVLSMTSPDVLDYLERLAIIGHNAGLAKFEGYFRALSDSYNRYFQRNAQFRTGELMEQITRLYKRVILLEKAAASGDNKEVLKQAGEFRADYVPIGNLDLIGIAMEHFQTQTGYEGETIYFLEENTRKWYTYTNARPMFYETGKNRRFMEKSEAPWGLNIAVEDLAKVRIHLSGAKCDARKRLSSSQETKGEITGEQKLALSDLEGWYYEDFGKLFSDQIEPPRKNWLYGDEEQQKGVELVFVKPDSLVKADFSQTGQQLSIPLFDKSGREIVIEMAYSKRESASIRYLERLSEKEPSCFLGKIYLRDGRIRMYPVSVFKKFDT